MIPLMQEWRRPAVPWLGGFLFCVLSVSAVAFDMPLPATSEFVVASLANDVELICAPEYQDIQGTAKPLNKNLYELDRKTIDDAEILHTTFTYLSHLIDTGNHHRLCFEPRHYLSYQSTAGKVELFLCFQCRRVDLVVNGVKSTFSLTSNDPEMLNALFRRAGVRIPVVGKPFYSCAAAAAASE